MSEKLQSLLGKRSDLAPSVLSDDPYYTPTKYASGDRFGSRVKTRDIKERMSKTMRNAPEPKPEPLELTIEDILSGFILQLNRGFRVSTENYGSEFEFIPVETGVRIVEKKKYDGAFFLDHPQLPVESLTETRLEKEVFVASPDVHIVLKAILYNIRQMDWFYTTGIRWYPYIVSKKEVAHKGKAVLDHYTVGALRDKTVVCYNAGDLRMYTVFATFIDFVAFMISIPQSRMLFHEVIFGAIPVKMYFDIDVELSKYPEFNEQRLFDCLVDAIQTQFSNMGISLCVAKDIVITTSHGQDKYSYHITIDNYQFHNMEEVKHSISKIQALLPQDVQAWIDWGVYTSLKTMRTLGSYKYQTNRQFRFQRQWRHKSEIINYVYREDYTEAPDPVSKRILLEFESCLITVVSHCAFVPIQVQEVAKTYAEGEMSESMVDKAMQFWANSLSLNTQELPFRVVGTKGELVLLKREAPTICSICDSVHEHENPFLRLAGALNDRADQVVIYYYCRRARENNAYGGRKLIGSFPRTGSIASTQPEEDLYGSDEEPDFEYTPEPPKIAYMITPGALSVQPRHPDQYRSIPSKPKEVKISGGPKTTIIDTSSSVPIVRRVRR